MAAGASGIFDDFILECFEGLHDLGSTQDDIRLGLMDGTLTPAASDALPYWTSGSGTTNFGANEATGATSYTSPGIALTSDQFTEVSSGNFKFDFDDVSIALDASGDENIRWAIIFNNTPASKRCMGWIEINADADVSLRTGSLDINPHASGFFVVAVT